MRAYMFSSSLFIIHVLHLLTSKQTRDSSTRSADFQPARLDLEAVAPDCADEPLYAARTFQWGLRVALLLVVLTVELV